MKLGKELICYFLFAILCTNLTGCGTIPSYEQLGNGYVEATYTRTSFSEPSAHRFALQYKMGWKTVTIWPNIMVARVKSNVALFSGYAAYRRPYPHETQDTELRIFIVKAPELPLDVTDEILWRGSKESGRDFVDILKTASYVYSEETDDAILFHFATSDKDMNVRLDWNQIFDIMHEVKEKGVEHKDRVWGTSYIEKEFKPETQK